MRAGARWGLAVALALVATACATNPKVPVVTTPRYPQYAVPEVPPRLTLAPVLQSRFQDGWQRFQGGDLRGASRDFSAVLKGAPGFYPATTALGFVHLADRQFKPALVAFEAATKADPQYVPAWSGLAEAHLGVNDETQALAALQRVLALDPKREAVRARIDLLKFRQLQSVIDSGRRARLAGKFEDAQTALERALTLDPGSALVLRELALTEVGLGALDRADAHARKAVQIDAADAEAHVALATVFEARGRLRDAAAALARAIAIEPRPEWREKREALVDKADMAALPPEYRALPAAETVSRALAAAYIGIRLESLVAAAPKRNVAVATDLRNHWAAPWILPLTQAGVMDVLPNHTFQPNGTVRRGDLAQFVAQLLALARPAELTKWRAARPRLADLSAANVFFPAASLAVASGAMTAQEGDRFAATRPATGPELIAAVARIEQLTVRR